MENPEWRMKLYDAMEGRLPMESLPPKACKGWRSACEPAARNGHGLVRQGVLSLDTLEELTSSGWMPRFTEEEAEARRRDLAGAV